MSENITREGRDKKLKRRLDRAHCSLKTAEENGADNFAEMNKIEKTLQQGMVRFSKLKNI